MIWESFYWKTDLLKQSALLKKRMRQRRWPDASFARCEQTIMLGFYSIRKLVESLKLTDAFVNRPIPVRSYPPTGERATLLNRHKFEQLYDLTKTAKQNVKLLFLCNQVIHSYIFYLLFDEDKLSAIWVASDRERHKNLFEIPLTTIINIFEMAGNDEVNEMLMTFDSKKAGYSVRLAGD